MNEATLLSELVSASAARRADAIALTSGTESIDYATLTGAIAAFASGVVGLGLGRGERVGIYLDKRPRPSSPHSAPPLLAARSCRSTRY